VGGNAQTFMVRGLDVDMQFPEKFRGVFHISGEPHIVCPQFFGQLLKLLQLRPGPANDEFDPP